MTVYMWSEESNGTGKIFKPTTKGLIMDFTTFVRKPFAVDVVEVTEENIAEISELVGTLKKKEDGTSYIYVDRRLVPNIYRVFPGFFMTKMGDNVRCYSKQVFNKQFVANTPEIETWVKFMNDESDKADV